MCQKRKFAEILQSLESANMVTNADTFTPSKGKRVQVEKNLLILFIIFIIKQNIVFLQLEKSHKGEKIDK